ncbi:MAG: hypothetical protein K2X74_16700, partial [Acetobacteraceae bacterium]|nr:hypothetical protein [Acetobacteraceae bacterium]
MPLIGYMDRFSARPGERLAVKVSSQLGGPYRADLVRVRHADPNPAGPGMKLLPIAAPWAGAYPSRAQRVPRGSFGEAAGTLALGRDFTLLLRVSPWLLKPHRAPQTVLALTLPGRSLTLSVDATGFALEALVDGTAARLATGAAPQPRRWYEIAVTVAEGRIALRQTAL